MKTAIIKTGFWLDDDVFELNSDTRLVYLCLLTNPQRDTLPAFRCSDRMLSAYTGYSKDLIDICRRQLIETGRILYEPEGNYYVFTKQDFVQARTGRDSKKIYDREYEKLPQRIKDMIAEVHRLNGEESTSTSTSTSTRVNHNDNNKHNDNNITNTEQLDENAIRLAELLCSSVQQNFHFVKCDKKDVERYAEDIDKLHRIDKHEWTIIEAVIRWSQNHDFWKQNIRSGSKLRKQFENLLVQAKVDHDGQTSKVVIAGRD